MFFFCTRQKLNQGKKSRARTRRKFFSPGNEIAKVSTRRVSLTFQTAGRQLEKKKNKTEKEKSARANGKLWKSSRPRKNFTDFKRIPGLSRITRDIYMKDVVRDPKISESRATERKGRKGEMTEHKVRNYGDVTRR